MRKLMWFAIGFVLSCVLCAYGLPRLWIIPSVCVSLALMIAALAAMGKWKPIRTVAMLCFGCAVGLCWFRLFDNQYLSAAVSLDAVETDTVITVTDYSYETTYGIGVDGIVEIDGKPYQVRAYLDGKETLNPGDTVSGSFRFRVTTPDGVQDATYHQGKGIFLLAYQQEEVQIAKSHQLPRWALPVYLRMQIKSILCEYIPQDAFAFAKALLLGDTTDLSYETDTDFKVSGIRHVVAVSGLHISILFGMVSFLSFRKRYLSALLGIPVLILFAAVAGFTPSVVRACVMSDLMLLAMVLGKEYDGPTALSFAVLAMLIVNPMAVTSVSLQLSAVSVAGIFLFRERIHNRLMTFFGNLKGKKLRKKLADWFAASVSITLSAMTLTTPLCACYFGMVSLIGVVTNLLALWVISFVFYGLMALCGLSLVWKTGAVLLGKLIAYPIRYVLLVAKVMADIPMAAVYTKSIYITMWLVFCYVLLTVFLLQKKRSPRILVCCACLGLCFALLASWAEPVTDDCRVTVLDVGQGQSILLQSEGRTFLVDCGGDRDTETADEVASTLLSQGIDRLDGVILTHYDADHAGGLEPLLTRVQTDLLLVPDTVGAKPFPQVEGKVCYIFDDVQLSFDDAKMTVFGPIYTGSSNENSLCVLFETQSCAILITGDRSDFGERMLLRKSELTDVDVLIAGHHGAKDSTSLELLQAVTPETVIISAGEGNRYGHPHAELLERLTQFGCTVYRTDLHGTIIYRR